MEAERVRDTNYMGTGGRLERTNRDPEPDETRQQDVVCASDIAERQ